MIMMIIMFPEGRRDDKTLLSHIQKRYWAQDKRLSHPGDTKTA